MDAFAVLADPTRRDILELLASADRTAGAIASNFGVSGPAVSRHLRVLRDEGFVRYTRDAQRRVYTLEPDALRGVRAWMDRTLEAWSDRFDALERHLDVMADRERAREEPGLTEKPGMTEEQG